MSDTKEVRRLSTREGIDMHSLELVRSVSVEGQGLTTASRSERLCIPKVEYTPTLHAPNEHTLSKSPDEYTGSPTTAKLKHSLSADELKGNLAKIPRDSLSFLLTCFPGVDNVLLGELLKQPQSDVGSIVEFLLPILDEEDEYSTKDESKSESSESGLVEVDLHENEAQLAVIPLSSKATRDLEVADERGESSMDESLDGSSSLSQYSADSIDYLDTKDTVVSNLRTVVGYDSIASDGGIAPENKRDHRVDAEVTTDHVSNDKRFIKDSSEITGLRHQRAAHTFKDTQGFADNLTITEISDAQLSAAESDEHRDSLDHAPNTTHTINNALDAIVTQDISTQETLESTKEGERNQDEQLASEEFDMALLTLCTMFSDMDVEDLSVALLNADGNTNEAIDAILAGQISQAQADEDAKRKETFSIEESKPKLVVPSILKEKFPLASADALADLYADCGYSVEAVLDVAQEHFQKYNKLDDLPSKKKAAKGYIHSDGLEDRVSFGASQVHNVWHNRHFDQGATVDGFRMHLLAAKHPTIARNVVNEVYAMYGYSASACNDHLNLLTSAAPTSTSARKAKKAARKSNKASKAKGKGHRDAEGFTEVKRKREAKEEARPTPQTSTLNGLAHAVDMSSTVDISAYEVARGPAQELALERARCFRKAADAFQKKQFQAAEFWAMEGRTLSARLNRAHARAADKLFKENNPDFPNGPLDLHGLHVDEGIRMVKIALASGRRQQFRIITGVGSHSSMQAKLKPAVRAVLGNQGYKHFEETPGVLLVYAT